MANSHDYGIANAVGSAVRGDLNVLFLEVEASNAGDSAPSTINTASLAAGGKLWMDTTTDTLKYYTGTSWVSVARQVKGSANDTDITGTIDPIAGTAVAGVLTVFTTEAKVGDKLVVSGETRTITAITNDLSCTVDTAFSNNSIDNTPEIHPAAFVVTDDGGGIDLLVDTDGKVGINCATPTAQLDVRGPVGTGSAPAGVLKLTTAELTVVDGDQLGRIEFVAPVATPGSDAILAGASIYAEADATFSATVNSTDLVFATGDSAAASEKMRIDSTGQVTFADGAIDVNIASHDGSNGLKLGGTLVTATAAQLNLLAGETDIATQSELDARVSAATTAAQGVGTGNSPQFAGLNLAGTALTANATELNLLDNVSGLVQADFTKLAAVDASAAELNLLDGVSGLVQADLTKLAAVDASATELNYCDGVSSAIQTQIDTKVAMGKAIAAAIVFG